MTGRAARGSRRQLQDYVNHYVDALSAAILEQLPERTRELGASIRWVSPLAEDHYREYRDAEFLERIGLSQFSRDLEQFWPGRGPSWDALAVISDSLGRMKPGVILVEAKSHILEIYGNGCQASPNPCARLRLPSSLPDLGAVLPAGRAGSGRCINMRTESLTCSFSANIFRYPRGW